MNPDASVTSLIPHRPPFLWVDRIVDYKPGVITAEKKIPEDLDIFNGHYPGNPIMPGVLLCEAIFQTGALLMARMQETSDQVSLPGIPVLTRIGGAKFKRSVFPGDTIEMEVELTETLSSVCFFKGKLKVHGKTAVQIDFSCALLPALPTVQE
jgi:3-hydroxyacyl-[acyl-carrier-protein] dehydratase